MLGKLTSMPYKNLEHIKLITILGISGKQCDTSGLRPIGPVNSILLLLRADCKMN